MRKQRSYLLALPMLAAAGMATQSANPESPVAVAEPVPSASHLDLNVLARADAGSVRRGISVDLASLQMATTTTTAPVTVVATVTTTTAAVPAPAIAPATSRTPVRAAVPAPAPAAAPVAPVSAAPASTVWAELRQCESGDNYAEDTGNGYYGAYQFSLTTWESIGYSGLPNNSTPAVQDAAAERLQTERGWGQWPACSRTLGL